MKIPKIFIPKNNLEKNTKKLLYERLTLSKHHDINFDSLEIEPEVKEWYPDKKYFITFDKSLKRLRKAGYERHLRPWESLDLLISRLEGKINGALDTIAKNILASKGEWFSMAVEREGKKLICYVDPENIRWSRYEERYIVDGVLNYSYKEELNIGRIPSQMWTKLKDFDDEFVSLFYNRNFKDLHTEIQEKSSVYLPPDGVLWPIGRGEGEGIYICGHVDKRLSRGVKQKNESP